MTPAAKDAAIERLTKEVLHDIAASEGSDTVKPLGGGDWEMDGVGPIPVDLVAAAIGFGPGHRLARFGRVLACDYFDFGPPGGVRRVLFGEKGALVYFPELAFPYRVQGVHWRVLPAVATALGVR